MPYQQIEDWYAPRGSLLWQCMLRICPRSRLFKDRGHHKASIDLRTVSELLEELYYLMKLYQSPLLDEASLLIRKMINWADLHIRLGLGLHIDICVLPQVRHHTIDFERVYSQLVGKVLRGEKCYIFFISKKGKNWIWIDLTWIMEKIMGKLNKCNY